MTRRFPFAPVSPRPLIAGIALGVAAAILAGASAMAEPLRNVEYISDSGPQSRNTGTAQAASGPPALLYPRTAVPPVGYAPVNNYTGGAAVPPGYMVVVPNPGAPPLGYNVGTSQPGAAYNGAPLVAPVAPPGTAPWATAVPSLSAYPPPPPPPNGTLVFSGPGNLGAGMAAVNAYAAQTAYGGAVGSNIGIPGTVLIQNGETNTIVNNPMQSYGLAPAQGAAANPMVYGTAPGPARPGIQSTVGMPTVTVTPRVVLPVNRP